MARERRKWTAQEDEILTQAVAKAEAESTPIQWSQISKDIPGRTNKDCRKRWLGTLSDSISKGAWTDSEDERLRAAVADHGTQWVHVAAKVKTRNGDQCAKHWSQIIDPSIDHSAWTAQEEDALVRLVQQNGTNWALIVSRHLVGRSALDAKNQYYALARKFNASSRPSSSRSKCQPPTAERKAPSASPGRASIDPALSSMASPASSTPHEGELSDDNSHPSASHAAKRPMSAKRRKTSSTLDTSPQGHPAVQTGLTSMAQLQRPQLSGTWDSDTFMANVDLSVTPFFMSPTLSRTQSGSDMAMASHFSEPASAHLHPKPLQRQSFPSVRQPIDLMTHAFDDAMVDELATTDTPYRSQQSLLPDMQNTPNSFSMQQANVARMDGFSGDFGGSAKETVQDHNSSIECHSQLLRQQQGHPQRRQRQQRHPQQSQLMDLDSFGQVFRTTGGLDESRLERNSLRAFPVARQDAQPKSDQPVEDGFRVQPSSSPGRSEVSHSGGDEGLKRVQIDAICTKEQLSHLLQTLTDLTKSLTFKTETV